MNLLAFILKSLYRNKRRSLLMGGGIAVSIFVISSLLALEAGFGSLIGSGADSVLNVYEKGVACAVSSRVFDSYLGPIKQKPQVSEATGVLRALYSYQKKENPVQVAGIDYPSFRQIKSITFAQGGERDFLGRSDGALVGKKLASAYGWKVGQTVSLLEDQLTFYVAGIIGSVDKTYEGVVLLQKDYLSKLRKDEGKSTYFVVQLSDPASVSSVARTIDQEFSNFPIPTKTQSEKDAKEQELRDFLELRRMLALLILAAIAVSVAGAANSVSMSVRERTREVGILRTLGFRKTQILEILFGESVLVAVVGGAIGIAGSAALISMAGSLKGFVPLVVSAGTIAVGVGLSLAIGLLGALLPGIGAVRVPIVESLRVVD